MKDTPLYCNQDHALMEINVLIIIYVIITFRRRLRCVARAQTAQRQLRILTRFRIVAET